MTRTKLFFGTMILATVALAGCGKNKLVKATEDYADKTCACKDMDCVKKETDAYGKVVDESKDSRGSDDDVKAIEAAGKKASDCITKLATAGAGAPADKKEDKKEEKDEK
jgi:hypothetical protein